VKWGKRGKTSSGKRKRGKKVPSICRNKRISVSRNEDVEKKADTNQYFPCSKAVDYDFFSTRLNVMALIVLIARSSAGLRPSKNLSIPNQKKMIPILMRNKNKPFLPIHGMTAESIPACSLSNNFIRL
jgi:hypothetical protein